MITFITTQNDKWYQGQIPQVRALRGRPANVQTAGVLALIDMGMIPAEQAENYKRVFMLGWSPDFVFDAAYIDALPRAADLVVPYTPGWTNRRGDPATHVGDCYYEQPGDNKPIGSISADGVYEKFQCNASETLNPTYYADWSLDFGDRTLRCWVRVK